MAEIVAQQWLNDNHEKNKNNEKEIKIDGGYDNKELKGEIKFEDYSKLEVVELVSTKGLTKVIFDKCPAIREITIYDNEITEIIGLDGLTELSELNCGKNKLAKIDISKNTKLVIFRYHENPQLKGESIKGLGNLTNIVRLTGGAGIGDGVAINLTLISKEELEEVAKKLDINVQGKNSEEIRKLIEERGNRDRENEKKLNDATNGLPGLLNAKGEVDDKELKEINDKLKEIKEVHNVKDHPGNAEILDNNKFNQGKLTTLVEKGKDYDQLVKDNQDLVDNGKISQDKIKGIKDANKDAADAIARLGVNDLKIPTLAAKLGDGINLKDIPTTLKDLLEENKKLGDALAKVGMDPKDKDIETKLENLNNDSKKLKITEKLIRKVEGDTSLQNIQAQVLIEVNK